MTPVRTFVTFAGAGGGRVDPSTLTEPGTAAAFLPVELPDWRWHATQSRTVADLLFLLCGQVMHLVPTGPVRLIGISLGGHLAFEVARRLQAVGREIGGLCVVDAFFGGPPVPPGERLRRELGRAMADGRLAGYLTMQVVRRALPLWARLMRSRWQRHARAGTNPWDLPAGSLLEYELSMRLLLRLTALLPTLQGSDLTPLDAPALLLRTTDNVHDDAAWRQRCPNLQIAELPGDHHTLNSAATVGAIRRLLQQQTDAWR